MVVDIAAVCNVGPVRTENQDRFVVSDFEITLSETLTDAVRLGADSGDVFLAVADGMGGVAGGGLAAEVALETIAAHYLEKVEALGPLKSLSGALTAAHASVRERAQAEEGLTGMGTTATSVLLRKDTLYLAHVGDSRAYLYRNGDLTCLTTDHSYWTKLRGYEEDAARRMEGGNLLAQCVGGASPDLIVEETKLKLRRGDRIMLCSDGLCGVVGKEEILSGLGKDDVTDSAMALLKSAFAAQTSDNVTAVVAQVEEERLPESVAGEVLQIDRVAEVEYDPASQRLMRRVSA